MAICAVCQDTTFWNNCSWTTYDGTVITNSTERDSYYSARYTSLQSWDDAEAKSVLGFERVEIIGNWVTADTVFNLGSGWGTSYMAKVTICTVGIARPFAGNYPYKVLGITSTSTFIVNVSHVIIDGIISENTSTGMCFIVDGYKENVKFINCIAKGGKNGFYAPGQTVTAGYFVYNCIAYGCAEFGIGLEGRTYYKAIVANCTVYKCNTSNNAYRCGIWINGYGTAINCISIGNGGTNKDYDISDLNVFAINCISSDTSLSTGTDCLTGITATNTFTDASNGDFSLLSTSVARDAGVLLDDVPLTDIAGIARDPDNIDIGAHEYDVGYVPTLQVGIEISGMVENSVLAIYKTSDGSAIVNPTTIDASGSYSTTYSYTEDTQIDVVVRKGTSGTKYLPYKAPGLITDTGFALIVNQVEDTVLNG